MRLTACSNGCFALLLFLAVGCGGSDDPLGASAADFSGEYTYEITGAGGSCVPPPRETGAGVYRITQAGASAEVCWMRDACDGETCHEGPVTGDTLTIDRAWDWTVGACSGRTTQRAQRTQDDAGTLQTRFDNHLEYREGDCSEMTLPCDMWQTSMATPCSTPCYDGYCSSRATRQAREDSSGGQ